MGKALYRKYRSQNLDEIVGQDHITSTLSHALKDGKISHAYLLTGPKGVGKTSIARILAHEVNGLAYSEDPHLDIIEIDAASNRRIDEIRDLREHIYASPTSAKYKVFIIDEVHMLTREAFNALLKTLEEPPAHVIFILATTETHKLPETIISRTQRYSFRPVPVDQVVAHLINIAKKENIQVGSEALELIAEHGEGSFRDSISLLDQASASGQPITRASVETILGRAPSNEIEALIGFIAGHEPHAVLSKLTDLYNQGFDASILAVQIGAQLRATLLLEKGAELSPTTTLNLLHDLLAIPSALNAKQLLEVTLLKYCMVGSSQDATTTPDISQEKPVSSQSKSTEAKTPSRDEPAPNQDETTTNAESSSGSPVPIETDSAVVDDGTEEAVSVDVRESTGKEQTTETKGTQELWEDVLDSIKKTHNTLYGMARMAKPRLEGDTLHLSLRFAFHHKQLNTAKNTKVLSEAVSAERGKPTKLKLELIDGDASSKPTADISTISNIFGGAELL